MLTIMTHEQALNATINKLRKLGYQAEYDYINCNNSCYLKVIKDNDILFIIRFSDHDLRAGNQLPAGVINDLYDSIEYPASISTLRCYLNEYYAMSEKEREYLWTNRLMISDPEFHSLVMVEPFESNFQEI